MILRLRILRSNGDRKTRSMMATSKRGTPATIRRIAASDRISGLIMLGFALAGLLLANLPFTAHAFEQLENFRIAIPHTNIDMGLGHWVQDGLLTVFFLTVGPN